MMKVLSTVAMVAAMVSPCAFAQLIDSQLGGSGGGSNLGHESTTNSNVVPRRTADDFTVAVSANLDKVTWWGQVGDYENALEQGSTENISDFLVEVFAGGATVGTSA